VGVSSSVLYCKLATISSKKCDDCFPCSHCCCCCRLEAEAEAVGFPLLVKAVSGGGGKGMKLATQRVRRSSSSSSWCAVLCGNSPLLLMTAQY
jgi:hypothetical protein